MKFTIVFTTLLCVSTSWAVIAKKVEDPKDKREAQVGYGSPGLSHSYQVPAAYSQGDASAISVGAGYSIGGAKPSYSFAGHGSSGALQLPSEGLSPSGHATIQLAPITLQPSHGAYASGDLSQLMSQLSHSLNSGALQLQPSTAVAEFHQGGESAQGASQGQELQFPQFSYGAPKYESLQLSQQYASAPAFSSGSKGLGSYTSTGPVLFTPSESQSHASAPSVTYGQASSGHSAGDASALSLGSAGHSLGGSPGHSFGGSANSLGGHSLGGASYTLSSAGPSQGSSGHSFGNAGHSLGSAGHSLGGAGHSLGSAGYSLGGSGHSLGGSGHSLGGSGHSLTGLTLGGAGHSFGGSYKQLSGGHIAPSKTSFKPSAYVGSSGQGESGHTISGLSGSYAAPSFGGFRGGNGFTLSSAGHGGPSFGASLGGFGGGSSKFVGPVQYQSAKSEGIEGASALSAGHFSSPPGTTYGIPSSSLSNNVHAESSNRPYYVNKQYRVPTSSFSHGSSAYRAPVGGHSSLSSYSSGPKYSFAGASARYEPSDAHGAASETVYNTIKYSEELKPRN